MEENSHEQDKSLEERHDSHPPQEEANAELTEQQNKTQKEENQKYEYKGNLSLDEDEKELSNQQYKYSSHEYDGERNLASGFISEILSSVGFKISQVVKEEHILIDNNKNFDMKKFNPPRKSVLDTEKHIPITNDNNDVNEQKSITSNQVKSESTFKEEPAMQNNNHVNKSQSTIKEEKIDSIPEQNLSREVLNQSNIKESNTSILDKHSSPKQDLDSTSKVEKEEDRNSLKEEEEQSVHNSSPTKKSIKTFDKEELKKIEDEINDNENNNYDVNFDEILSNETDREKERSKLEKINNTMPPEDLKLKSNSTVSKQSLKDNKITITKANNNMKNISKDGKSYALNKKVKISNDSIKLVNKALESKVQENRKESKEDISPKYKTSHPSVNSKMNFFKVKMSETAGPISQNKETPFKITNKTGHLYKQENKKSSEKPNKPFSNYGMRKKNENFALEDKKKKVYYFNPRM